MKILTFLPLLILLSCGKARDPDGPSVFQEAVMPDGSNVEGFYTAKLMPMNHNFHFSNTGLGGAHIKRQGDTIGVMVELKHSGDHVWHRQDIYLGTRCPDLTDDTNRDGYIDIVEGRRAFGMIIMPLDSDIDSQYAGRNDYPTGDAEGAYSYVRTGSFDRFFADLKSDDDNTADNIVKIDSGDGISFLNKVIIIQGIRDSVTLPVSVASENGLSPRTTLPIACGIFKKSGGVPEALASSTHRGNMRTETPREEPAPVPVPVPAPEVEEDDDDDGWIRRTWRRWTRRTPNDDGSTPPPPPESF